MRASCEAIPCEPLSALLSKSLEIFRLIWFFDDDPEETDPIPPKTWHLPKETRFERLKLHKTQTRGRPMKAASQCVDINEKESSQN
jgi:hypothetical protein